MSDDVLPEHIEEALGKAMDIVLEAETRAEQELEALTDADLDTLAERMERSGGSLGNFLASMARKSKAFRAARSFMDCNGVQQASWPQIWNWYDNKGDS